MRLYLAHEGYSISEKENARQPLSDEGRISLQKLASFLARGKFAITSVFHSNKLCAKQTAIILSQGLGAGRVVQESPVPIDTDDDVRPLHKNLESNANLNFDGALLVADRIFLDRFLSYLICREMEPALLVFDPGTFVSIERRANTSQWIIQWVVKPNLLGI